MSNNLKMTILFLIVFFFASVSFCRAETLAIDKIKPAITEIKPANDDKFFAGTVMIITGDNFNKDNVEVKISYVSIHDKNKCEIIGTPVIATWDGKPSEKVTSNCPVSNDNAKVVGRTEKKQIKAMIPYDILEKSGFVAEIWVENKKEDGQIEASYPKIQITITEGEPLVAGISQQ